jgi:lysophospholipase L1-like esterase
VALGDSLAAAVGATSGKGYVDDIYAKEHKKLKGLVLENLSCSGATTGSMLDGGGCSYTTGTQLGDAEAFLAAHSGKVALVTIDIGANDVDQCVSGTGIDMTCFNNGIKAITTNLPLILSGLASAGGSTPVVGMSYYDPFLAAWVLIPGSTGQSIAGESLTLAGQLNTLLENDFGSANTADVAGAFETSDSALTGKWQGASVPVNVARICEWTHMCTSEDFHADNAGHARIAKAFEKVAGPLLSGSRRVRP